VRLCLVGEALRHGDGVRPRARNVAPSKRCARGKNTGLFHTAAVKPIVTMAVRAIIRSARDPAPSGIARRGVISRPSPPGNSLILGPRTVFQATSTSSQT
jgi:hypothetical protein